MSILNGPSIEDCLSEIRSGFDWGSEEIALKELIKRVIYATWDFTYEGCNGETSEHGAEHYVSEIYKSLKTGEHDDVIKR